MQRELKTLTCKEKGEKKLDSGISSADREQNQCHIRVNARKFFKLDGPKGLAMTHILEKINHQLPKYLRSYQ